MRYDSLSSPISEADPCGPDLDEEGDERYLNYMMLATNRLPARFYAVRDDGVEAPFDKASIDLDDEQETIEGLLQRSRDVRLLTLDARFQILTGNLIGFSEALQGLGIVVSQFWGQFLPQPFEGDQMLRQNTLEGLDDPVQILLPLQYAVLVAGTGSLPTVTFRNYTVAAGKAKARANEEVLKLPDLDKTLGAENMKEKATASHEALASALAALKLIRDSFIQNAGHEFAPNYDRLNALLGSMDDIIVSHRPELAPAKPAAAAGEAGEGDDGGGGGAGSMTVPVTPTNMPNHEAARAALEAAAQYFRRSEPSSPAFILVHQAANLIGRPLVDAMAALMPQASAKAMLRISGAYDFDIDLTRMKSITEDGLKAPLPDLPPPEPPPPAAPAAPAAADPAPEPAADDAAPAADGEAPPPAAAAEAAPALAVPPPPPPPVPAGILVFVARTRADATGFMLGAEQFFRAVEPSSPIPLLLEKARSYLNRDFSSIMNEVAPKEPPK